MLYENISISVLDTEYLLPIHLLWEHINVLPLRFFDNLHDLLNFKVYCITKTKSKTDDTFIHVGLDLSMK